MAESKISDAQLDDLRSELVTTVQSTVTIPMDTWAVAATLESTGFRDDDAIAKMNSKSVFHLARDLYPDVKALGDAKLADEAPPTLDAPSFPARLARFTYLYLKGMVFALPMAGQILAVLVLRYSLWAWLDFDNLTATLVAIGTIGSFMVTGGLVQAIGREGTFYIGSNNYILLDRVLKAFVGLGVIAGLVVAVLGVLSNIVFPFFSWSYIGVVLLYFLLLTPLWLLLAVLYMLQDNLMIVGTTLAGTGIVHLSMTQTSWGILVAHGLGLIAANLVAASWSLFRIRRLKKTVDAKYELSHLPRASVLLHTVEPFLIYGLCYFSFLFVDRLIAWSASDYPLPLVIWFRTPYELGMDWALLSLVFTIAVLEYTINEFSATIIPREEFYRAKSYQQFNGFYRRFYLRQVLLLAITATLSIIGTYYAVCYFKRYDQIMEVHDFFHSRVTYFTYWGAAVGYSILAFALLNSLFFFSLFRPWVVVKAIAPALAVNIVVGFIASRAISYEYAVLGLVSGSLVFALLTYRQARDLFGSLDYYYYSAY